MMTNRDVFAKDPSERKLENQGVANVNDDASIERLNVLKYELDTFVCSGQYADGLERILGSFLANIGKAEQPAVWVSGFYGSGKSHLVKMLRALWVNQAFSDGQRARDIAQLPQSIRDLLHELDVRGKQNGGLHAASGTLGAGSDQSVRLALLGIVFKSKVLPEDYSAARLVMWLKREEKLAQVQAHLKKAGRSLDKELLNMYVSESLHRALVAAFPEMYTDIAACGTRIETQFRPHEDVTSDELIQAITYALAEDGKNIPLTVIVLDEVQQYIGSNEDKSIEIQEALEAVSKRFAGRLLFIATGQAALAAIDKIRKLEGRFTVPVQLRDEDVDEVVRKVVLEKKPAATPILEEVQRDNVGELAKHLTGTQIGKQSGDAEDFPRDYPILPARRRFWEHALRSLDATSVKSQLRNQLGLVHKVVQTNLDKPIGHVVPADALFFEQASSLLLSHVLDRRVHDFTVNGERSDDLKVRTTARAVGIVYLINQIIKDRDSGSLGLKADVNTVADLLVTDLNEGSASLRAQLPQLLKECDLLDEIEGEYVIQTKESAEWRDRFKQELGNLDGDTVRLMSERDERIRATVSQTLRLIKIQQGEAKVPRTVLLNTDTESPPTSSDSIITWVPGLSYSKSDVIDAARTAGTESPNIFVHLGLDAVDKLRTAIKEYKAADITMNSLVASNTIAGQESRASMQTIAKSAEQRIQTYVQQAVQQAQVYQGGGAEILGSGLRQLVEDAAKKSLMRLYPKFELADHASWGVALEHARRGAPDALAKVGHQGDVKDHPVATTILKAVNNRKIGKALREELQGSPYGWPADAIEASLLALVQSGQVSAEDGRGNIVRLADLTKTEITRTHFKSESTVVQTTDRLAARGVYATVGINHRSGTELEDLPMFWERLDKLAQRAGGEPPLPARPSLPPNLQSIRDAGSANEAVVGIARTMTDWKALINKWTSSADLAEQRHKSYQALQQLVAHINTLPESPEKAELLAQAEALRIDRQLLSTADPTASLLKAAATLLRTKLNEIADQYNQATTRGINRWQAGAHYESITQQQRNDVLAQHGLTTSQEPSFAHSNAAEILSTLGKNSIEQLRARVEIVPGRFDKALEAAKRLATPDAPVAKKVRLDRRELKSDAEIDVWLKEVGKLLKQQLAEAEGAPVRPD